MSRRFAARASRMRKNWRRWPSSARMSPRSSAPRSSLAMSSRYPTRVWLRPASLGSSSVVWTRAARSLPRMTLRWTTSSVRALERNSNRSGRAPSRRRQKIASSVFEKTDAMPTSESAGLNHSSISPMSRSSCASRWSMVRIRDVAADTSCLPRDSADRTEADDARGSVVRVAEDPVVVVVGFGAVASAALREPEASSHDPPDTPDEALRRADATSGEVV
mmetsp:Transcript_17330/g.69668  ORF Transcript_17330/g.69668 Transcript_17330/m.69668 type:complete len:220 (+) Transcript_17330:316-975(+)